MPIRIEIVAPGAEARALAAREVARSAKKAGAGLGCFILVMTLVPLAIPGFIFLGPTLKALVTAHFGSFPMKVDLNDSLEIDDRTETLDDTLVTVGVNGKLTIRRCHLKGAMIVAAGPNAQITIIDSALEGTKGILDANAPNVVLTIENSTITSAEEIVEEGSINTKVAISKGSKLTAAGVAFPLTSNGDVSIDHSTVEGKLGGLEMKTNGKVRLTGGADVKSDGVAIDFASNGHLQITSSKVESKTTAVHAANNLEGTLRSATLVGPKAALDVGANARLVLAQSTVTGPKIVPRGSTVDER